MEYVGRKVRKECPGLGVYHGTVNSYDSETKLFQISYRNGGSECLRLDELVSVLGEDELTDAVDSRSQKRLKCHDSGTFSSNNVVVNDNCGSDERIVDLNLNANESSGGGNGNGLDLNVPLDVSVVDCMELDGENAGSRAGIIDLNVNVTVSDDVNGEMKVGGDSLENPRKELGFDLNLGVESERKEVDGASDDVNGEDKVVSVSVVPTDQAGKSSGTVNEGGAVGVSEAKCVDEGGNLQDLAKEPSNCTSVAIGACDKNDESTPKGNSRKRRKKTESADRATPTVLRRSARRGGTSATSVQVNVPAEVCLDEAKHEPQSPQARVVVEEKDVVLDCKESEECNNFPTKPKLPPSSDNLNLEDIPICDVFSVYSFLRSFSTLLFLSPFELGDFVEALRCKTPSLLFDYIHLSLLQILRKHLESLSDENSESASTCLRSLNWNLLDLITWPIFMVEYLLTHHSVVSPSFDLSQLKFFESDYYKQPASVKIELLQCLCDDVNEVEMIRSELNKRTLSTDPSIDFYRKTAFETPMPPRKARAVMDVSGSWNSEVVGETADWNSDECCLCKMDGSLICCDGCPAAFHARCVGVTTSLLPEGDWYCPECSIDKGNPLKRAEKPIRGAILLGKNWLV